MAEDMKLTSDDYAELADSYEQDPPRGDEVSGVPYVAPSAMRMGRPPGGGDARGASPTRALRLPARLNIALEDQAAKEGLTVSDILRSAVGEYFERRGITV